MDSVSHDQTLPVYKFAAQSLAPEQNFLAWRDALSPLFDIDASVGGGAHAFRGDFATYFMGPIILGTGDCTAQNYQRTARTIARSGIDPFLIQLYTEGGFIGTADKRDVTVKAGDVCMLDMARDLDTFSPRSKNITLIVPRGLLAPLLKDADALHGTVLAAASPQGGILADYLRSLHGRVDRMSFERANALTNGTVSLAAACFGPFADRRDESKASLASALLFAIRRHIDANISSPTLTVDDLSHQFAISRASLYRLFEPLGGVAKYVRKRRLYHSLLEITSSASAHKRIGEIAYGLGFTNESDFSRAFRAAYGVTPREARESPTAAWSHVRENRGQTQDEPMFVQWLREI